MNKYKLADLSVGMKEQFEVVVDESMMTQFLALSGDENPLHCDEEYARKSGMKGRVVYGLLHSSFYSRLVGVNLPGKFCLLQEVKISYRKPVYIGDPLFVEGEVVNISEATKQVEISAKIINANGDKVSTAKIKVGLLE